MGARPRRARGLSEPVTRTRVYIAIGAIQAVLFHQVVLSPDELVEILTGSAQAILKLAEAPEARPLVDQLERGRVPTQGARSDASRATGRRALG